MIEVVVLDWGAAVAGAGAGTGALSAWVAGLVEAGVDVVVVGADPHWVPPDQGPGEVHLRSAGGDNIGWAWRFVAGAGAPADAVLAVPTGGDHPSNRPVGQAIEDVIAGALAFASPVADTGWRLEVEGLDPERERHMESWLTVANGRTGTRGSLEEEGAESFPAVYVAGVFGRDPASESVPELVRGPEWTRLYPRVGTRLVALDEGVTIEHRRVLDLRQGMLLREWRQRLPSGENWSFRSGRFASLADRGILVLEAEVDTGAEPVALAYEIPLPTGQDAVETLVTEGAGECEVVTLRARGGMGACFAISTREEGHNLRRLVAVERAPAERAPAEPAPAGGACGATARQALERAEAMGAAVLRARHRHQWRQRWRDADVVVDGDIAAQRALRFSLYHLISSGDPESDVASIGARGLTGSGYRGHVFWDTEVFILPFLIWTHPPTARALLAYRYRTLPAARAKAAAMGYAGALYPWESADTGEETTPSFVWLSDGTRLDVVTGAQEHHISADVAWAAWQYWSVTGDDSFMISMGAEMIVETARFWATRAIRGDDGRYHIRSVVGPDEYHEGVDDNAFTNVMARWNIETALRLCDELLPAMDVPAWDELAARLELGAAERRQWKEVAAGLVDGFDPESLVYEQFAGFSALDDVRAVDVAPRPFGAETVVGVERLRHVQVVKQADVLMLAAMLPEVMPAEVAAANYRHYEPRTSHGSSLSPAIHALVAARIGSLEQAAEYFELAGAVDLDDRMGNAADGVHVATMGGLWQAAVMGFGGVVAERNGSGHVLRIDPHLPPGWNRLVIPFRWRGGRVQLEVDHQHIRLDLEHPAMVAAGTGPPTSLDAGCFVSRTDGGAGGWSCLERLGE